MVAQWLRYSATDWKVAGSIPDGVIGIFHSHNPSDRTMALGSNQPLTEMSTRSISWG
jgi:proteasome lid subunit RPN8/RPN11